MNIDRYITHSGIILELKLEEFPLELEGRGWIHFAKVVGKATIDDLKKFKGVMINDEPILGVETFMIHNQTNMNIGLLLKTKKW